MKSLSGRRKGVRVAFPLAVVAAFLMLPTDVAAVTSGGWSNLGHGSTSTTPPLNAKVETFLNDGNLLYVGGDFNNAGGLAAADHIATWNGTKWAALGGGLGDAASAVYAIARDPTTGLVFAGGSFSGQGPGHGVTVTGEFNGTAWAPIPGLASKNGTVYAMTVIGRYLYIAGAFSKHTGNTTPANGIVRWNIDTHTEEAVPATNTSDLVGTPGAIVADGSGGFYLGGSMTNVDNIPAADFVAHWNGTWSSLGSVALNNRVRTLAMDGSVLYVGGDFTTAGGVSGADKVAKWNGSWSAVGGSSFFGTSSAVNVYGIWADSGTVIAAGTFNNAGGLPKADGIAAFNGTSWTNVGTNKAGTDGPVGLNPQLLCVRVVGATLFLGGLDPSIGGNTMNGYAASFRFRQPDGQIGITGSANDVGDNIYNTTGKKQTKSQTVHRNRSGTFNVDVFNDGLATDTYSFKGPGSSNGFDVTYTWNLNDVTAQVVAGTFTLPVPLGVNAFMQINVSVANTAKVGAVKSILLTITSTGGGSAKDAVKAKVTAS